MTLEGARVTLRLPQPGDVARVFAACQDPAIQHWVPIPVPYERKHAEWWVDTAAEQWRTAAELRFVVAGKDGDLIGAMGLHAREAGMRELGYWTAPPARRAGLTAEAARLLCEWAFDELKLRRIEWLAAVGNVGSLRVAEKTGFVLEGTMRARLEHRREVRDAWVAGLLPSDQ